jgi:hypothetical protein
MPQRRTQLSLHSVVSGRHKSVWTLAGRLQRHLLERANAFTIAGAPEVTECGRGAEQQLRGVDR